jgi:aminoglycoside phosphotransferase (APT) family kinase protein
MEYSKRLGTISDDQFQKALDRFGLGKLIKAEPVSSGNFGQNVFLTTSVGKYVLRGVPHYPWQFRSEQFMARLLHEKTRIPVPYPYIIDDQTDIFGWNYVLMPRLNGQQLSYNKEKYSKNIARAFGENLVEMQKLTWGYCGQYDLELNNIKAFDKPWEEWIISKINELNKGMATGDKDWIMQVIYRGKDALKVKFIPTFVMHDYQDTNMVIDKIKGEWKVTGVFDLMENYFGDGESDLSRMYFMYHQKEPELANTFLNSYLSKTKTRPGFEKRFPIYMILDRLVVWEWAKRNGKFWWDSKLTFREWCEPHLKL